MNPERVVDIWFRDGSNRFGSGYLLTDRLILTAGHVADNSAHGDPCIIRRWKRVDAELDAALLWRSQYHDAALIRLDTPVAVDLGASPVFGRVSGGHASAGTFDCASVGFPRANRNRQNERIDKHVVGQATYAFRSGKFDVFSTNARPVDVEDWAGFSGAAVFRQELLFALIVSVPEAWGGESLTAVAVEPLFEEAAFRKALSDHGLGQPKMRKLRHQRFYRTLLESLRRHYCFIDRNPQRASFESCIRAGASQGFIFSGTRDDMPELFMQRLAAVPEFREIVGDLAPERAVAKLDWIEDFTITDSSASFAELVRRCASLLSLPLTATWSPAAFIKALQQRTPAAIWWEIEPNRMGPGHSELLGLWLDFCAEVQQSGRLYWFACWLVVEPPSRTFLPAFLRPHLPDPGVERVMALCSAAQRTAVLSPPLGPIEIGNDLRPWLDRLRQYVPLDDEDHHDLHEQISRAPPSLSLSQFTVTVEGMLHNADTQ
ncbi:serine protease [Sphingomonas sp. LB-2]|uniref:S1 family peptidase n=1 Tax=Sphingomonas caeni TaxID=2984949 RepID=UPI0022301634|nr:serine protease [Sphingomonas caeni]MCW3848090.1 serine protease [Sphingomonas caeni]